MILVDSNILIDYYRSRNSELAKKIDSMPIAWPNRLAQTL